MRYLFIFCLIFFVIPILGTADPIVLDNEDFHVYLSDSYSKLVDETHEKDDYFFEVTNKTSKVVRKIKIRTYWIDDAFLTPGHLNLLVHVLPPDTNGRSPVCKYLQYDLHSLKRTSVVENSQGGYFSPNRKYGVLTFTYNAYKSNEFDAIRFFDFSNGSVRLKWLWNPKEKINLFENKSDENKKGYGLEGPIGWSPDEKRMAFIVSWGWYDEKSDISYHGYYLVYVNNLDGDFVPLVKPVDFKKMGYEHDPWEIEKIELSKEIVNIYIRKSKEDLKTVQIDLPK